MEIILRGTDDLMWCGTFPEERTSHTIAQQQSYLLVGKDEWKASALSRSL